MVFDPRLESEKLREDPQGWLRDFTGRAEQMQRQAEQAQAALAETEVTMTSRDQSVTVTVNIGGVLQHLRFSPRAESLTLVQLATTIMEVYQQACAEATSRTTEIMSGVVGDNPTAMAFLRRVTPTTEEEATG